jgi:hypothetical protein
MGENQPATSKGMSTTVKVLIGCGVLTIIGIICGVLVLLGSLGIAAANKSHGNTSSSRTESEKFANPKAINTPVVVDDVSWTVTEATDLGSTLKSKYGQYGTDCEANSGKFIKVKVTVTNNSSKKITISDLNLIDSQKRSFDSSTKVYGCIKDDLSSYDDVNPGISANLTYVYEVPSDATGLKLKVSIIDYSTTTPNFEYIDLEL